MMHKPIRPQWASEADRKLRDGRMTQTELSEAIGISRPTINRAINSGVCADETKEAICRYLKIVH